MKKPTGIQLNDDRRVALAQPTASLAAADAAESADEYRWVQVASAGQFLGYRDGSQPFELTRDIFQQAVDNIRSHPSFVAGPTGEGSADVIPWDYNHASEMDPTLMAVNGAPAAGWTADLKIVDGPDGIPQLHALTRFLEPARGYVKAGSYKWSSIAMTFNRVDGVSGQEVGAVITSIALTNTPFIEGMNELIAASKNAAKGRRVQAMRSFYEQANNPEQAFDWMKELFGLPTLAEADAVMGQLTALAGLITAGEDVPGVDVDEVLGQLRTIMGLPLMAPAVTVLDSATEIIQQLMEGPAEGDEPAEAPAAAPQAVATTRSKTMELIKTLSKILKVTESEEAVTAAVGELVALASGIAERVGVTASAAPAVILEAAEKVDVRDKLNAILQAIGVDNSDDAVNQIAQLMEQAETLKAAMPELEGLRVKQAETEAQQAEADVDAAMASYSIPAEARGALLLQRTAGDDADAARTAFLAAFPPKDPKPGATPAPTAPKPAPAHLTRPVATSPQGGEFHIGADGTVRMGAAPTAITASQQPGAAAGVDLANYPGRNNTERAIAYLRQQDPTFEKKTWEAQVKLGSAFTRQPGVTLAR